MTWKELIEKLKRLMEKPNTHTEKPTPQPQAQEPQQPTIDPNRKTNIGLVKYAEAQLGRPYWYGCFGQKASEALYDNKRRQYPRYYTATDFPKQYGQKVHDCIGLIKGYMWTDNADSTHYEYQANGFKDMSADMYYNHCTRKGDSINTMPEVPGILVFMKGHVGIYVGDGWVIEARGHSYGVVKTYLKSRPWKKWAYIEEIQYL